MKSENMGGLSVVVNWTFTDIDEKWSLSLSNRTLCSTPRRHAARADASVVLTRATLLLVVTQQTTFLAELEAGNITIDGDAGALLTILGDLDGFQTNFAIVEP